MARPVVLSREPHVAERETYDKITYGHHRAIYKLAWSNRIPLEPKWSIRVPSSGGVYRLVEKDSEGAHSVYYVGRTETRGLTARFHDHLPNNEAMDRLRKYHERNRGRRMKWAEVHDSLVSADDVDDDRRDIEWWLFQHYEPEGNEREPSHSGRYQIICVNPENERDPVCYRTDMH